MMTLQTLLPEIDSTLETRRSTPATMLIRGGGAIAANRRDMEKQKTKEGQCHDPVERREESMTANLNG
jgi:hypothetical protein